MNMYYPTALNNLTLPLRFGNDVTCPKLQSELETYVGLELILCCDMVLPLHLFLG